MQYAELPKLKGYARSNWSQDPFSYGAYSYLAKGSGEADRAVVAEPIGDRVYFAGEALNPHYQSSVHAAYETGERNARALLETSHQKIAIIGAGMAGLTAAHLLADKGRKVTVIEGRDRIGGRIWTDRSLGTPLDLGASWIHGPEGNPISKLADEAGLARSETVDNRIIRGRNGKGISDLFAPSWVNQLDSLTAVGTEFKNLNLKELEANYKKYGIGYEGSDVIFPNGYDQVLKSLAGDYEVLLSQKVSRIAHTDSGVTVTLSQQDQKPEQLTETQAFDAIIVTVPLGVLKKGVIQFDPALPAKKQQAIARMGMGVLDKLYLIFENPFWDQTATWICTPENELKRGQFNYWLNFHKYLNAPVIAAFNAGSAAIELGKLSDEDHVAHALATLASVYKI